MALPPPVHLLGPLPPDADPARATGPPGGDLSARALWALLATPGLLAQGMGLRQAHALHQLQQEVVRRPMALDGLLAPSMSESLGALRRAAREHTTPALGSGGLQLLQAVPSLVEAQRLEEAGQPEEAQALRADLLFRAKVLAGLDTLGAVDEGLAALRLAPTRLAVEGIGPGIRRSTLDLLGGVVRRPAASLVTLALLGSLAQSKV